MRCRGPLVMTRVLAAVVLAANGVRVQHVRCAGRHGCARRRAVVLGAVRQALAEVAQRRDQDDDADDDQPPAGTGRPRRPRKGR
jgi:hypothetical protein